MHKQHDSGVYAILAAMDFVHQKTVFRDLESINPEHIASVRLRLLYFLLCEDMNINHDESEYNVNRTGEIKTRLWDALEIADM